MAAATAASTAAAELDVLSRRRERKKNYATGDGRVYFCSAISLIFTLCAP